MSITGDADGGPAKVGVVWIDVMTGMNAGPPFRAPTTGKDRQGRCMTSRCGTRWPRSPESGHNALTGIARLHGRVLIQPRAVQAFEASDGWFAIGVGTENVARLSTH